MEYRMSKVVSAQAQVHIEVGTLAEWQCLGRLTQVLCPSRACFVIRRQRGEAIPASQTVYPHTIDQETLHISLAPLSVRCSPERLYLHLVPPNKPTPPSDWDPLPFYSGQRAETRGGPLRSVLGIRSAAAEKKVPNPGKTRKKKRRAMRACMRACMHARKQGNQKQAGRLAGKRASKIKIKYDSSLSAGNVSRLPAGTPFPFCPTPLLSRLGGGGGGGGAQHFMPYSVASFHLLLDER
ncbi:hypothetical protein IF1G_04726 [Cordyceps javanica]|uniref:Uncharacterized protein n=1 Tax=Cordyceps javanica TaxID=43265 RepID=A0A545V365_9HYPO|nr:hypothetical protein IF1G_04726 [Cordyceps javanica]